MVRVEFKNVGRGKKCWTEELEDFDEHFILRSIRRNGALMSRAVSVGEADSMTGWHPIFAGMQLVGSFRPVPDGEA